MSTNPFKRLSTLVGFAALILFTFSCKQRTAPEFPYPKEDLVSPTTQPLTVAATDTISWRKLPIKSLEKMNAKRFSWDKLKTANIDIGFPYPAKMPLDEAELNMEALTSMDYDIDTLPEISTQMRVIHLGSPKVVEADRMTIPGTATRGVKELDDFFGLPSAPTAMLIHSDGTLWMGGNTGELVQYDSENLMIYEAEQGLDMNNILTLMEDKEGRVWIGSDDGVFRILDQKLNVLYELAYARGFQRAFEMTHLESGEVMFRNESPGFTKLSADWSTRVDIGQSTDLFSGFVIKMMEDSRGWWWFTSTSGIVIYKPEEKKMLTLRQTDGLLTDVVFNLMEDSQGRIWASGATGISIISKDLSKIQHLKEENGLYGFREIYSVFESSDGHFWMGTGNGMAFMLDEATGLMEKYVLTGAERNIMFEIYEDSQGQIWLTDAFGGLFVIDRKGGKPASIDEADGLDNNQVWSTVVDEQDRVWIGSGEGLDRYDPKTKEVKSFSKEDGLVANFVYQIQEDSQKRIWAVGSNQGISIVDPVKQTIAQIPTKALEATVIRSVVEDQAGNIWLGDRSGMLLKYDTKTNEVFHFLDSVDDVPYTSLLFDKSGILWIGTRDDGIYSLDPETNIRKKYTTESGLTSGDIFSLTTRGNELWNSSAQGLERLDLEKGEISLFTKYEGMGANDIYALIEKDGKIYAGTSQGITILEQADRAEDRWLVHNIGKEQGMTMADISQNSFSFDAEGRLWGGSDGLMLTVMDPFDLDTTTVEVNISAVKVLDEEQKFLNEKERQDMMSGLDSLWIWERNKLVVASPSMIDSLSTRGEGVSWSEIDEATGLPTDLQLAYDQNFVSFYFNSGQFRNKGAVDYAYVLEGVDKSWSEPSNQTHSENYRDLPPGDYVFKVAAKGYNNVWSDPAVFEFSVLPPWWKTRWAYFAYLVLFGFAFFSIADYRSRWLKRENKLLEEKVDHRTAQLRKTITDLEAAQSQLIHSEKMASLGELTAGIAHEIQNPMNFINNFSEVSNELIEEMIEEMDKGELEEAKEISSDIKLNLEKINHHGKRASSIVRGMLEHSRNSSGQKEAISINVLADEYLRLAYHGLRAKDKSFNAKFETDFDEKVGKVEVIPQDLGRVMLNLINNAFHAVSKRFKDNGQPDSYQPTVTVTTKKLKDQVRITVQDNGTGIPEEIKEKIFQPFFTTKPSGEGTGLGLSLTYDIITQGHGGALELDSKEGEGTTFTIYIPDKK